MRVCGVDWAARFVNCRELVFLKLKFCIVSFCGVCVYGFDWAARFVNFTGLGLV